MWGQALLAGVALLGVLVTANVLVGSQTRARHVLKDELELVDKMPPELGGRAVFEQYVSESLQVYVDRQRHRRLSLAQLRSRRTTARLTFIVAPLGVMLSAVGLALWGDDENGWAFWEEPFAWMALFAVVVQIIASAWNVRVTGQIALRHLQLERESRRA